MKLELSHDTLAKCIYEKFSEEDKMRGQIRQVLKEHLVYYKDAETLLSKDDLNYIAPYVNTIELEKDALELVRKSKKRLNRRKKQITAAVVTAIILLITFNLITRYANKKNEILLAEEDQNVEKLAKEDSLKRAAELRADTLYQQLLETNPEFTQELIASFDTLKTSNRMVKKERNVAQSSTLSSLGELALEQNDENYAFRLAAKAWELNPENKLACELLYKINEGSNYNIKLKRADVKELTKEEHQVYVANLIAKERSEKGRGELDEKKMQLIFNQQNRLVHNKEEGVKEKLERYQDKFEEEANKLKEKVKEIGTR
jgi:hypothetical protein